MGSGVWLVSGPWDFSYSPETKRFFSPNEFWKSTRRFLSEFPPKTKIDDEIYRGIENKREVIQARRTEEPGGWSEGLPAPVDDSDIMIMVNIIIMIDLMISPVMITSDMLRTTLEMLQQKNTNTMQMMIEAKLISFFTDCLFRQWEYLEIILGINYWEEIQKFVSCLKRRSENGKYENIFPFRESVLFQLFRQNY